MKLRNVCLTVLSTLLVSALAFAGNAIDINDLTATYAGAYADFVGFENMQIISAPTQVPVTDSKGNKICTCGVAASGVPLVSCQMRTATYYTAVLIFDQTYADFPYLVKQGKNVVQDGDTSFASIENTKVYLTLPLYEVDPNGIGITNALTQGTFPDVNRRIAQMFLTAPMGSDLSIWDARMDVRVSDTDGSTHATVTAGQIAESNQNQNQ